MIRESLESGMSNITKGMENFLMDLKKSDGLINISTTDKSYFKVGKNLATTKGKVIFQNDLNFLNFLISPENRNLDPLTIWYDVKIN